MINMIKTGCQLVRVCKTRSLFLFSNVVSVCYVVKSDRLLGMAHLQKHASLTRTAEALFVHITTVQNWLNRFRREGLAGLREKPRPGRANKLTGEQLARLPELIDELTAEKPGGRVKGKDIQARLAAQFGVHYALSSLYLLLHRQGWSWITVRSKHPKSDPIAQAGFKKTLPPKSVNCSRKG